MITVPPWLKHRPILSTDTECLALCTSRYNVNSFSQITIEVLKETYKTDRELFYQLARILGFYGVSFSGKLQSYDGGIGEFPEVLSIALEDAELTIDSVIAANVNTDTLKSQGIIQAKQLYGVPLKSIRKVLGLSLEDLIEVLSNSSFEKIQITEQFNSFSFWENFTEIANNHSIEDAPINSSTDSQSPSHNQPIAKLNLPKHLEQKLIDEGINTIDHLIKLKDSDLHDIQGLGRGKVNLIMEKLSEYAAPAERNQSPEGTTSNDDIDAPVTTLQLSVRARKCLNRASIITVADLLETNIADLKHIKNTGAGTIKEIREKVLFFLVKNPALQQSNTILRSLNIRLSDSGLGLSNRTLNALTAANLLYICDLIQLSEDEVLNIDKLGKGNFVELKKILKTHGLFFGLSLSTDQIKEISKHSPTDSIEQLLKKDQIVSVLKTAISDLELSVRALGSLSSADVKHTYDLVQLTEQKIFKFPNMGKKTVTELSDFLEAHGLRFGLIITDEQLNFIKHHKVPINFSVTDWLLDTSNELFHSDLSSFNEREIVILEKRLWTYKKKLSLEQISTVFNITRERIRQIETKLIKYYKKKYKIRLRRLFEFIEAESKTNGIIFDFSNSKINFDLKKPAQSIADFLISLGNKDLLVDWECKVCSPIGETRIQRIVTDVTKIIKKRRERRYFSQNFLTSIIKDVASANNISSNLEVECLTKYFKHHAKVHEDRLGLSYSRYGIK